MHHMEKDFEENIGLIDLLEEINKIDGIVRIRLGSLEPKNNNRRIYAKTNKT